MNYRSSYNVHMFNDHFSLIRLYGIPSLDIFPLELFPSAKFFLDFSPPISVTPGYFPRHSLAANFVTVTYMGWPSYLISNREMCGTHYSQ